MIMSCSPDKTLTIQTARIKPWRYLLRLSILSIIFIWPALLTGKIISYYQDSASYLKGGEYVLQFTKYLVSSARYVDHQKHADTPDNRDRPESISGIRSPTYSVFTYLLRGPQNKLLILAAVQSAIFSYLLLTLLDLYRIPLRITFLIPAAIIIALTTSAPWYISYAMPDIFSGLAILSIAMLVAFAEKLSRIHKIILGTIVAFAVTAHTSNIPVLGALILLVISSIIIRWRLTGKKHPFRLISWIIAPFAVAIMATTAINYIGFGKTSIVAKHYPVTLARSISDGPARWHLQKHCDEYQYAVCEVFDEIPKSLTLFLWGDNGLRNKATPEQMDRIREEEFVIVKRAALEYPLRTIWRITWNTLRQLWSFGYAEMEFNLDITHDDVYQWDVVKTDSPQYLSLIKFFQILEYVIITLTLLFIIYILRKRIRLRECDYFLIGITMSGLFINAAVCGSLSTVADRYQGRVIWVLPVVITVVALYRYLNRQQETRARI